MTFCMRALMGDRVISGVQTSPRTGGKLLPLASRRSPCCCSSCRADDGRVCGRCFTTANAIMICPLYLRARLWMVWIVLPVEATRLISGTIELDRCVSSTLSEHCLHNKCTKPSFPLPCYPVHMVCVCVCACVRTCVCVHSYQSNIYLFIYLKTLHEHCIYSEQ